MDLSKAGLQPGLSGGATSLCVLICEMARLGARLPQEAARTMLKAGLSVPNGESPGHRGVTGRRGQLPHMLQAVDHFLRDTWEAGGLRRGLETRLCKFGSKPQLPSPICTLLETAFPYVPESPALFESS